MCGECASALDLCLRGRVCCARATLTAAVFCYLHSCTHLFGWCFVFLFSFALQSDKLMDPNVCFIYLFHIHLFIASRHLLRPLMFDTCDLCFKVKFLFPFFLTPPKTVFLSFYRCPPSDDLPKPQITVQPETTVTVLGSDVRLTCTAASSSSSPMTFAWRKDQELLRQAETENYAHVRAHHQGTSSDVPGAGGGVMEYTTILHLRHVTFAHEGRYQCIITNHFGSTYSSKARLSVNGRSLFSVDMC